jgi:hypothetical protein
MIDHNLVSLGDFILEYGKDGVSKILSTFESGNKDMDDFIKNDAIYYHEHDINRTYLLFKGNNLVAYFSIAITSILFTEESDLDEKTRLEASIPLNRPKGEYLIGHIAKTKSAEKGMIDIIIPIIKSLIANVQNVVGGNVLCLDTNSKKLMNAYSKHGFSLLGDSPEVVGKRFKRMFCIIQRGK